MDNYDNFPKEWKEERCRRMDSALTEIDEITDELKVFGGIPHLVLAASRIENPKEREMAITTVMYSMGFVTGRLVRSRKLVNEGMTVPEEEK